VKRQVISSVVDGCALFVVIAMMSRSGSTQSAISDCLEPFGNPPCNANNNATFNDGKNTGCKVEFHWLRCDGVSHGSVFDSCTNMNCKGSCSCSCATNGYGVSWQDTCTDVVKSQSFHATGVVLPPQHPRLHRLPSHCHHQRNATSSPVFAIHLMGGAGTGVVVSTTTCLITVPGRALTRQ
jgi:hypothetical protein